MTSQAPELAPDSPEAHMLRFLDGDPSAFTLVYRALEPGLMRYLQTMTRDVALAEDVVQTTFTKMFGARDVYRRGTPLFPWLRTIAHRTLLDELRRARCKHEHLTDDGANPEHQGEDGEARVEAVEVLRRGLSALRPTQREALMVVATGMSMHEAAERFGTSRQGAKTRVHRARQHLRAYVNRAGYSAAA